MEFGGFSFLEVNRSLISGCFRKTRKTTAPLIAFSEGGWGEPLFGSKERFPPGAPIQENGVEMGGKPAVPVNCRTMTAAPMRNTYRANQPKDTLLMIFSMVRAVR